jgi:hypothetical protein
MDFNFHKIHSLFSSIDHLIATNNVKQCEATWSPNVWISNMNLFLLGKKLPKGDTNSIFSPKFSFLIKKIAKFFEQECFLVFFFQFCNVAQVVDHS